MKNNCIMLCFSIFKSLTYKFLDDVYRILDVAYYIKLCNGFLWEIVWVCGKNNDNCRKWIKKLLKNMKITFKEFKENEESMNPFGTHADWAYGRTYKTSQRIRYTWAASWLNQQNECAPSKDSDQPGHSPSLMRVWWESLLSAWRKLGSLAIHWAHSKDWSDWADAQADLSLCWAHSHLVGFGFCHERLMAKLCNGKEL